MTSNDMVMASTAADAAALDRLREAISDLLGRMTALETAVVRAAGGDAAGFDAAQLAVADFAEHRLHRWHEAAERELYPAGASLDRARLLVEGLLGEWQMVEQACSRVARAGTDRARITADVGALRVLLVAQFGKTADLLLPALAAEPGITLASIADPLLAAVAVAAPPAAGDAAGHGNCLCGESDRDVPELDVREIPHAIRHATVFGAFDAVAPGEAMILIAHHDPVPLLHQLTERTGGRIDIAYEQRGPQAWRLRLTRL